MPVPDARPPPQDVQMICETRPVGSPPLKTLDGLIWPKPAPWAKKPAGRPSVGTAACPWLGLLAHPAHTSTTATPSQRPPPPPAPRHPRASPGRPAPPPPPPPFPGRRRPSPPARRADLLL